MKTNLKLILTSMIIFSYLNAADLQTDATAMQKLRDTCGTYFGAATPLSNLSAITNAQLTTKITSVPADFATGGQITTLLNNAATFFTGTTLLTEVTTFQGRITSQGGQATADSQMTTLRQQLGTYFGLTAAPATLAAITDAQIAAKVSVADFKASVSDKLTAAKTTFANYATYLGEVTAFETRVNAKITAQQGITDIGRMDAQTILPTISSLTSTTDQATLTAVVNQINSLYTARTSANLSDIIKMLNAAQAKFTTDTTYTGKALQAEIENVTNATDKIASLNTILTNTNYLNYVKTTRGQ